MNKIFPVDVDAVLDRVERLEHLSQAVARRATPVPAADVPMPYCKESDRLSNNVNVKVVWAQPDGTVARTACTSAPLPDGVAMEGLRLLLAQRDAEIAGLRAEVERLRALVPTPGDELPPVPDGYLPRGIRSRFEW